MGDVDLRPLTAREQRARDFLFRGAVLDLLLVVAAAAQGLFARGLVQAYCTSAPDGGPTEGTDGYSYCARVNHGYTWLAACAIAVLLAVLVAKIGSRYAHGRKIALLVVFLVVVANTVVVFSLPDLGP